MSTTRRFQWLICLLSMALVLGLSTPASAEEESDGLPDTIENYLFLCLLDQEVKTTPSGTWYCCDGAACYACTKDFDYCFVTNDSAASSLSIGDIKSLGLSIRNMQQRPTESQLRGVCSKVEGDFNRPEGFGYLCVKPDCNGKGDYCSIVCPDGRQCTATTPDVLKGAASLIGILQNGDNILRSKPSASEENDGGRNKVRGGGGGGDEDGDTPCGPDGCLY